MSLERIGLTLTLACKGNWEVAIRLRGFRVFFGILSCDMSVVIMHSKLSSPCIQCAVRNYCLGFTVASTFVDTDVQLRPMFVLKERDDRLEVTEKWNDFVRRPKGAALSKNEDDLNIIP